ncbi:PIN domain-containing protein [Bradyrhizobium sp.]|uniref:PIN domain-containing protein n=1 Tax=Bradyrhizobium sp. TaxID=376 RepID=UPI003BB1CF6A
MYLFDTNVVSELRRVRPHGAVLAWLKRVDDHDLHLSAVTIGEIPAGIEITRKRDQVKAAELEAWLEQVARSYNILSLDARTFRAWARLVHRKPDELIEGDDRGERPGSQPDDRQPQRTGFRPLQGPHLEPLRPWIGIGLRIRAL